MASYREMLVKALDKDSTKEEALAAIAFQVRREQLKWQNEQLEMELDLAYANEDVRKLQNTNASFSDVQYATQRVAELQGSLDQFKTLFAERFPAEAQA